MEEEEADLVWDGYDASALEPRSVAALRLADALVVDPRSLTPEAKADLIREFGPSGVIELALVVALAASTSKLIIALGLEPAEMQTTVVAAPGSAR